MRSKRKPASPKPSLSLKERFASGELVHLTDLPQPERDSLVPDIRNARLNYDYLEHQRELYGRENVITGLALDHETHQPAPDPLWLGVYVTDKAFHAAHEVK